MLAVALFSVFALLVIGWMLRVNAKDRKVLEKRLEREFGKDSGA